MRTLNVAFNAVIPERLLTAAAGFGKLLALGLIGLDECLPLLVEGAQNAGYRGSLSGCQTKLAWVVQDSARAWEGRAGRCRWAICKRLAPMLAQRLPSHALIAAAHAENTAWGDPLRDLDVTAVVREQAAWWLSQTGLSRRG